MHRKSSSSPRNPAASVPQRRRLPDRALGHRRADEMISCTCELGHVEGLRRRMPESVNDPRASRDLTRDHLIAGFARAAATIAWEGSLQVVLDQLAEEVLAVSRADTCAVAVGPPSGPLEIIGAAGYPTGYLERIEQAFALGAPMIALRAYTSQVQLVEDVVAVIASDPRFTPLCDVVESAEWTTLVAIPLRVRQMPVGVLIALYAQDEAPSASDVAFLNAIAEHGAIAVETTRLLAESREKAALDERNRLARDLHDAISQLLFSMRLRARALQIAAGSPDATMAAIREGLGVLASLIERAVADMRELVFHLRPVDLREHDLSVAIRRHAEAVAHRDSVRIDVVAPEVPPALPQPMEDQIYRIAQEAIGNSANHAQANRIGVRLIAGRRGNEERLLLEITDDGVGFDPVEIRPGHLGLANMRARAAEIDADLTISSSCRGTTVRLEVPVGSNVQAAVGTSRYT